MAELSNDQRDDQYVWIFGLDDDEGGADRALSFRRDDVRLARQRVPAEQLRDNVGAFVRAMGRALEGVPSALSGYSIDSIEISAEVGASGKVSLLGNGAELVAKGGIAFTLTRAKRTTSDTSR
jgi:hypothetical protein